MLVIYPGSFDPFTLGHEDIINRASSSFDQVKIAISEDNAKSSLFSVKERLEMAEDYFKKFSNVSFTSYQGLTVNFVKDNHSTFYFKRSEGFFRF